MLDKKINKFISKIIDIVLCDLIDTIFSEIDSSSSTVFRTLEGEEISTDVGYVAQWFEKYVDVLPERYKFYE